MLKFKKREKIIFSLVMGIITIFLIQRVILSGLGVKISDLNKKIKLSEAAIKSGLSIQKNKEKIIQDYKEYAPFLTTETQDKDVVARFLKEVEKITQESGLSVVNLTPDNKFEVTAEYKKCKAELRLEGDLEKFLNFLNKVQGREMLIKIDKLTVSSKDDQGKLLRIEATMSMIVPLLKQEVKNEKK